MAKKPVIIKLAFYTQSLGSILNKGKLRDDILNQECDVVRAQVG